MPRPGGGNPRGGSGYWPGGLALSIFQLKGGKNFLFVTIICPLIELFFLYFLGKD